MTDLTAPLIEPDLEAGQPKEEVKVKPDEPQEWHDDVWSYNLFGISVDGLLWKHRLIRMTSRLGYERSLLDRCYLRFWLLPAVAASVIIAEGYSRDWSYMTMAWENTFFMSLIGLAMLQPAVNSVYDWLDDQGYSERLGIRFRPHVLFPDICLAAAAFEHTRRGMYNLLEEANWGTKGSVSYAERGILCSEHLVMFWVVVLPLIAGRRIYVLGMYSGALAVWHYYTGLPGLGTFCAGAILLVPVLIVEITTSGVYDELHRCFMGISALSKGTGGGTCLVDWESGRIVEASPDLIDWWGDYSPRMRFEELFRDPEDKDEMFEAFSFNPFPYIWEPRGRGENGYSTRDFFKRLGHWEERKKVSHVGEEFKVTSMRCAHNADGTDVWNNLAGGFWCQNSKATVADEVPLSSVLTDELHDNEDKWSDEELTKCFEQEACRIKGSLQNVDFEDMATALSTRWLKRLEKDEDKKRKGRHARAFLRSHALDILLSCLTKTEVGRTAIFVAAGLDPDRESIESAAISPAVPLRLLLSKTSDVPKVLMDSLLNLLSSVGKPGSEATPTDMQWVLLLLSAAVMDASEVPVRMAIRNIQVIEAQIQQITDGWKEMVQKFDDAPECPLKVGDAVWAEWPRTGRWFRGEIIELLDDYAMIQWLQRPTNVKGGHEDHYLISAVGEYFNFDQPTEVLKVAVLPALFSRPQPIPEQEEEGWSQFVDAAENLTTKYHQLRALFEDLGKNDKSELKKMSEFKKKKSEEAIKTLHGTTKSIIGVKKDFASRAKAPGAASALVSNFLNEVVDIASDLEAELAKRLENATAMDGAHERLLGMRDKVAKCCLDAERLRGRYMEELFNGLHSSIYGEDAAFLVQDFNTTQSVKNTITNAIKLADQCWKEAVQFAAETIDGPMAVGCEEVSRAATRYKEMRPELKKIQERLAQVERSAPEIPPGRKRKVIKKGSSLGSQIAMETKGYLRTQSELSQAQEEAAAPAEWAPDFPEVDFNSQAATAAFTAKEVQHVQRPATIPEQSSTVDADDQASLGQQPVKDSPPGAPQETETETKAAVDPEPGSKAIPAPATIAISSKAEVELAKPASKEVACCMQGLGRFQERCCGMHS